MTKEDVCDEITDILDKEISFEELTDCIQRSKRGKALAEDLILNDFLKSSGNELLYAVLNLFNQCLKMWYTPGTPH